MRKILFAMFAALALLGCDKDKQDVPANRLDKAITFDYVTSRADATLDDLKTGGFGVWAFINNATVTNYTLMNNQDVKYEGGEWGYSPLQYWLDDTEFSFVGVYPYDENGTYYSPDANNTAVELTVSETPSGVDFLIAKNTTNTSSDEGFSTTVDLQFKHMLTSVGLNIWRDQAKHTSDQMRVTKVTLSNIRKGGKYSTAEDSWTYNDEKLSMEYENTNLSDDDNIGAATMENGSLTTGGTAASPFGQMMLLPQTLDDSNVVSLKIVYELKRQNAADWEKAELETVLPSITWNAGQRYTYNVVLSSVTDITVYYIQTKVDPWGTPQVGGTVIIK